MLVSYIFILLFVAIVTFFVYISLKIYFRYKQDVYKHHNHLLITAITTSLTPLLLFFSSSDKLVITIINYLFKTNLSLPEDTTQLIFYVLYLVAVLLFVFMNYKYQTGNKEIQIMKKETHLSIAYPSFEITLSPFLHERIKELFELKHEKQNLKLIYDEKEKILLGEYSEPINKYRFIIYCNQEEKYVSIEKQNEVFLKLKAINDNQNNNSTSHYQAMYFYFIQKGDFDKNLNNSLKCYDEDSFLNIIIDFTTYLKKNIEIFDEELSDIGKISLQKSFIEPKFNKGNSGLEMYLDTWLEEKSYRHISLLADYGMGKTTFLKYYTNYLSKKIIDSKSFSRYPVYISLTNTSPMSNDGIAIKIQSFVSKELGVNYALFEKLVHRGKIVFILDGFDEMGFIGTEKIRFEQFNSIWQLATKDNKILISGRPSYLPTLFERKNVLNVIDKDLEKSQLTPFTEVVELDYFQEEEIKKTLKIYYKKHHIVKKYMKYIKQNHAVFDLCKRPSMLHMTMVILPKLYEDELGGNITAISLMNKYIEFWISRQESKNIKGYFNQNDNRKKEFLVNFFLELSSQMYQEKILVISKARLDNIIEKAIEKENGVIKTKAEVYEGLKNEIYTGYFIEVDISSQAEDCFKFVHKSIFEFFVSTKIIALINEKNFVHPLLDAEWSKEIIDFINTEISINKDSNYPSLIQLRNSVLDKILFIPITNITINKLLIGIALLYAFSLAMFVVEFSREQVELSHDWIKFIIKVVALVIFALIMKKFMKIIWNRLNFIAKSYYIDFFKNNNNLIMSTSRLQYFLDFHSLYKRLTNIALVEYSLKNLILNNIFFKDSFLNNVEFNKCFLEKVYFSNCQLEKINFNECSFKYIKFDNVTFAHVKFETSFFKKKSLLVNIFLETNTKILYLISIISKIDYKRFLVKKRMRKIIFENINLKNFDEDSISSFKNFIKENNITRKNILCEDKLLNETFFT